MDISFVNMSQGTQKKFFIVAALIAKPDLLVMDEPFSALDKASVKILCARIKEYGKKNTVVMTSHNLDVLEKMKTHVFYLQRDIP